LSEDDESRFSAFPEVVTFTAIGRRSLKDIHLIALSVVVVGVLFAILAPPAGYVLFAVFVLIAAGYDMVFIRKYQRPLKVSLYLRTDPVEAQFGGASIGEIKTGTIITEMDEPNELGFRPEPRKRPNVWHFESEEEARLVAKRLSMYLQVEKGDFG
jgi:hypothetical protein